MDEKIFFNYKQSIPKSSILSLNDYINSVVTTMKATNGFKKDINLKRETVPFAIAAFKWKLEQSGMV